MHLTQRIERHLNQEHAKCRDALAAADVAVAAMLDPPKPKKGDPPAVVTRAQRGFAEEWTPLSKSLTLHLDDEDRILPELAQIARSARPRPDNLDSVIEQLMAAHVELRRLAAHTRGETMFLDPQDHARRAALACLESFEAHTRTQETQIYPQTKAGASRVVTAEHNAGEDVIRNVRAGPRPAPEPETPSLFARFKGIFRP